MVKPVLLGLAAIPGVAALLLIAVPMLTQPEIPFSAAGPSDRLDLQFTRHQLEPFPSAGPAARVGSQKSEVLLIRENGAASYTLIEPGRAAPSIQREFLLDPDRMLGLVAFVKETGIASIPAESFPVRDGAAADGGYQKSVLKITLNGVHRQLSWPDQNATDSFVPPILTQLDAKLDGIIADLPR